ncbi:MAG: hypothetical protein ACREFR_08230 [Limisphaerales bacterium]
MNIFCDQIFQAGVHRANPSGVTLRGEAAEKFQEAAQLADDLMVAARRGDEFFMIAIIISSAGVRRFKRDAAYGHCRHNSAQTAEGKAGCCMSVIMLYYFHIVVTATTLRKAVNNFFCGLKNNLGGSSHGYTFFLTFNPGFCLDKQEKS